MSLLFISHCHFLTWERLLTGRTVQREKKKKCLCAENSTSSHRKSSRQHHNHIPLQALNAMHMLS